MQARSGAIRWPSTAPARDSARRRRWPPSHLPPAGTSGAGRRAAPACRTGWCRGDARVWLWCQRTRRDPTTRPSATAAAATGSPFKAASRPHIVGTSSSAGSPGTVALSGDPTRDASSAFAQARARAGSWRAASSASTSAVRHVATCAGGTRVDQGIGHGGEAGAMRRIVEIGRQRLGEAQAGLVGRGLGRERRHEGLPRPGADGRRQRLRRDDELRRVAQLIHGLEAVHEAVAEHHHRGPALAAA